MNKEKIENKAEEYAKKRFPVLLDTLSTNPWPDVQAFLAQSYKDGAAYALSHQWIPVDERLPEDKEHIIICYQSYHEGRYLTLYMTDRYEKEAGFNGGWIKPEQVIAWLPIPPLNPKKEERL